MMRIVAILAACSLPLSAPAARSAAADPLRAAAARARAWQPGNGSAAPRETRDGIRFDLPFASARADRFFWDLRATLDLSDATTIRLDVSCNRPGALRALALYFESGDGWYVAASPLPAAGRQTLIWNRSDFSTEGAPSGWDRITRARLSPWRGEPADTTLTLHRLSAGRESLVVVEGHDSLPNDAERRQAAELAARVSSWLADAGIGHSRVRDTDLARGALRGASAAVLCYTARLPDDALAAVRRFSEAGGQLMVFYSADERLAEWMGFRLTGYRKADRPLQWASFSFPDTAGGELPARVYQESGNLYGAEPAAPGAAVIAWWEDAQGRRTSEPAWLASERGTWMTHILLRGDRLNKQHLLAGLLARRSPGLWPEVTARAMERAGRIDSFESLDHTLQFLSRSPDPSVRSRATSAVRLRDRMRDAAARGRHGDALVLSRELRDTLTEAYARAQPPFRPALAGVWDHHGVGWTPGDWDQSMRRLAASGLNAVFPNLAWAGVAHYPSEVLPPSDTFRQFGDQLGQALAAGRRHGVQVHVWVVLWNLGAARPAFVERARREGRLLADAQGRELPWLCPAHPANRAEMMAALREIAARPIDGLHLDYVRYPVNGFAQSSATRGLFEAALGRRAARWPADVLPGGPLRREFERWRAETITSFVRETRAMLRAASPDARLSAAVFGGYPESIASIGQDWGDWLNRGLVDFVTPMNYTENLHRFTGLLGPQLRLPGADGRVFPGIGVEANESSLLPDQVVEQVAAARRLGANGFVLFDLNPELRDRVLPLLRFSLAPAPGGGD